MIASIELVYNWAEVAAQHGRERYNEVREICDWLPIWEADQPKPGYYYSSTTLIDLDTEAPALLSIGIEFKIKRFRGNYFVDRTMDTVRKHVHPEALHGINTVHVHIPNIGLLSMNEVDWLEDACTEELQCRLDEGWRILAVCPPDSVRRPTYILGRINQ